MRPPKLAHLCPKACSCEDVVCITSPAASPVHMKPPINCVHLLLGRMPTGPSLQAYSVHQLSIVQRRSMCTGMDTSLPPAPFNQSTPADLQPAQDSFQAWPSGREFRRCGLESFGSHSDAGVLASRNARPQHLSFLDGGAFDFPVNAMREEYTLMELVRRSTEEPDTPRGPLAAVFSRLRKWAGGNCSEDPSAAPPPAAPVAAAYPHSLTTTKPRVAQDSVPPGRRFMRDSAGGSLVENTSRSIPHSLWSLQPDGDFPLENLVYCDLLCANASVPFGHTADPAMLRRLLCSDTGEWGEEELPAAPVPCGQEANHALKPPARGIRAMLLGARKLPERLSFAGRSSMARQTFGGARRATSEQLQSFRRSFRRNSSSTAQHRVWSFLWPTRGAVDAR